jgi:hypothetical protein
MKTSRTKYSKFNKNHIDKVGQINIGALPNIYVQNVRTVSDRAYIWSLSSFLDNGYENIFIETEELYDFLRDTKIITHGDISSQLYAAIENRKYTEVGKWKSLNLKVRCYNFMIYAPINVINTALAVTLYVTDKQMEYFDSDTKVIDNEGKTIEDNFKQSLHNWMRLFQNSLCWTGKMDSNYITLDEKTFSEKIHKDWTKKDEEDFHVILNTLFYMNAFPDYVYEGVPKRAVLDNEIFVKKRITLTPNEEFFEEMKKSPHLRRGHFRTYFSDYFTNMKCKTVWIEPVFVKGSAVTVEDGISE